MSKNIEEYVETLLSEIGDDPNRNGLKKTPKRVAEMWKLLTSGYKENGEELISKSLFPSEDEDMVLVRDINFYSMCEHHLLPFFGRAHVAFLPKGNIVGISKIAEVVDIFAKRLQLQERLTHDIASTLMKGLGPHGVAVVIEARHMCMEMRGVQRFGSDIVTSSMLGAFRKNAATRAEFMSLIGRK